MPCEAYSISSITVVQPVCCRWSQQPQNKACGKGAAAGPWHSDLLCTVNLWVGLCLFKQQHQVLCSDVIIASSTSRRMVEVQQLVQLLLVFTTP